MNSMVVTAKKGFGSKMPGVQIILPRPANSRTYINMM